MPVQYASPLDVIDVVFFVGLIDGGDATQVLERLGLDGRVDDGVYRVIHALENVQQDVTEPYIIVGGREGGLPRLRHCGAVVVVVVVVVGDFKILYSRIQNKYKKLKERYHTIQGVRRASYVMQGPGLCTPLISVERLQLQKCTRCSNHLDNGHQWN